MKSKILVFLSCLMIGYIFLPIVFRNIPIGSLGEGIYLLYIIGFLLLMPRMFLSKQMLILYLFVAIYYIHAQTGNNPESGWLAGRILNLFIGVSLYSYFFNFSHDYKGMRIIFWFTFIIITISSITTLIGLQRFPAASRELASSVYGDIEMTSLYKRIGILGYGFITSLTYFILLVVLLFKEQSLYYKKGIFLSIGIIVASTVISAQYTAQFLLFSISIALSWLGFTFYRKHKFLVILLILAILITPIEFYVLFIDTIASNISGDILKGRMADISSAIESDAFFDSDTHISARFERIPFLISEFLKNPLTGGGETTGHVFWLDHLSLFGIIGIIPWIFLLIDNYRKVKSVVKQNFYYYQIALAMFILLGFMKGSGSKEQLIILFFVLPLGLFLNQNELLYQRRINKQ